MPNKPVQATLPGNVAMEFQVTNEDVNDPHVTITLSGAAGNVEALFQERSAAMIAAHLLASGLPQEVLEIIPQELRDVLGL